MKCSLKSHLWILALVASALTGTAAETSTSTQTASRQGLTLYVSQLGDNSEGRSWRTAFKTIQAALNAIPDDRGGHRIIVRPDTYAEANLDSKHKGAAGAYNRNRELYKFVKTMETYRKTMAQDTTLILSTDGEFFKYLKNPGH